MKRQATIMKSLQQIINLYQARALKVKIILRDSQWLCKHKVYAKYDRMG